jgi:hypothetical protein
MNTNDLDKPDPTIDMIRIREQNRGWLAEQWDGTLWNCLYVNPSLDRVRHWVDFEWVHPNIDTNATD